MLLIYGLGNNEPKYLLTKHNIGRFVLENFAKNLSLNWQEKNSFCFIKANLQASIENKRKLQIQKLDETSKLVSNKVNNQVYLLFSRGYMNTSGSPLVDFINYYKLPVEKEDFRLIILQDDSDQYSGQAKFLPAGGSGGHKGVTDIYKVTSSLGLNLNQIWRLKIGIRPEGNKLRSETFVLKPLTSIDQDLSKILSQNLSSDWLGQFLSQDFNRLQTSINSLKVQ